MGSSTQLYNLGWNDFDSSLRLAVKGLRSRRDLVDVTLAAGGKTFPAHKLILSAASSLFLELLKITPCQHPVILLAGIGARELEQVLDFVYTGEVAVRPSELSALLQAAHVLEIKGLVQGSITAEKPEDQEKAEAALAASTEEGEKVSAASLAAATKTGLLDTVSMGSEPSRNRKKKKRRYSDCCDGPHDKWGKYDSEDDSSDSEGPTKEIQTNTIATQTVSTESSVSQTIQGVVKSNALGSGDCGNKAHKQSVGTLTSVSISPTPVPLTAGKLDQSTTVTGNPPPTTSELGRHLPLCIDESSIIPPHHLEMNEDAENNKEDSLYSLLVKASQGGSNQPGVCPLCGTAVRQARNLRRHLFTSCKLRTPHLYHAEEFRTPSESLSESRDLCDLGGAKHSDYLSKFALSQLSSNVGNIPLPSGFNDNRGLEDDRNVIKQECEEEDSSEPEEVVCRPSIGLLEIAHTINRPCSSESGDYNN